MPLAMSDVESPLATMAAILTSVWVSALPAEGRPLAALAAHAAPDAVGTEPTLGPPDVPVGLQALIEADRLVQGGPGVLFLAAPGLHDGQVLKRGGQFHRRPERPVVRDSFPKWARIRLKESVTAQAGHGRPGRVGLRRGLRLTGLRRGLRHLPIARGESEPDQIR